MSFYTKARALGFRQPLLSFAEVLHLFCPSVKIILLQLKLKARSRCGENCPDSALSVTALQLAWRCFVCLKVCSAKSGIRFFFLQPAQYILQKK